MIDKCHRHKKEIKLTEVTCEWKRWQHRMCGTRIRRKLMAYERNVMPELGGWIHPLQFGETDKI